MAIKYNSKGNSKGFSLLEVMITLLILSVGLLGLAGLQAQSLRFNHFAFMRGQASIILLSCEARPVYWHTLWPTECAPTALLSPPMLATTSVLTMRPMVVTTRALMTTVARKKPPVVRQQTVLSTKWQHMIAFNGMRTSPCTSPVARVGCA